MLEKKEYISDQIHFYQSKMFIHSSFYIISMVFLSIFTVIVGPLTMSPTHLFLILLLSILYAWYHDTRMLSYIEFYKNKNKLLKKKNNSNIKNKNNSYRQDNLDIHETPNAHDIFIIMSEKRIWLDYSLIFYPFITILYIISMFH